MDLILGPFADAHLAGMTEAQLAQYDQVLDENDQDLLPMMMGQSLPPDGLTDLINQIASFAKTRLLGAHSTRI